jgi:hypothetical protein
MPTVGIPLTVNGADRGLELTLPTVAGPMSRAYGAGNILRRLTFYPQTRRGM